MELLKGHRAKIIWCICLVLLLLPIAQSLACSSVRTIAPVNLDKMVSVDITQINYASSQNTVNSNSIPRPPGCHSTKAGVDNTVAKKLAVSDSVCDGDCCQYCMTSYITHTPSIDEPLYDSIYFQNPVFALKPDILSVPATPPPIV